MQPPGWDDPTPGPRFDRRGFVRATLGTGMAAAAGPLTAQTVVKTTTAGLLSGEVFIPVGDVKIPAFRAVPQGRAHAPVVLVVSEIFGVNEYIADVVLRFAHAGYFALAPELFVRQGDAGSYGEISKLMSEVVEQVPDAQVMADLAACLSWAQAQGADTGKAGITGFCWGGRMVWLFAAHHPGLKAGVAWYGRLSGPITPNTPQHPIDKVASLGAPVLGLYAGQDAGIPQDTVDRMKVALSGGSAPARRSEIVVYPQVPHAFHADYRASYREAAANDAWQRCLAWFKAQGVD